MEQLHEMQQNIDRAKKGDFKVGIHKMEVRLLIYYAMKNVNKWFKAELVQFPLQRSLC